MRADREARTHGMDLVGIFHSHPDCDAYFSATDLKNSCPWYSFVVIDPSGTACTNPKYGVCSGGLSVYAGTADAAGNYWGGNGPKDPVLYPTATGNVVSSNVTFIPWWCDANMSSACPPLSPDGLIYYGRVEVVNNYLALFIRNWGRPKELNRFSRVILASPQRSGGRININTAETAIAATTGSDTTITTYGRVTGGKVFNPLTGMPGMLAYNFDPDSASAMVPADDVDLGSNNGPGTSSPDLYANVEPVQQSTSDRAFIYDQALVRSEQLIAGMAFSRRFGGETTEPVRDMAGKPWWFDGRYYKTPSQLLTLDGSEADPELISPGRLVYNTFSGEDEEQYEEKVFRFSRMANLLTTRSDVFEINILAQSGYLSATSLQDDNGDGQIDEDDRVDYRNDFVVTGEKKMRSVYER